MGVSYLYSFAIAETGNEACMAIPQTPLSFSLSERAILTYPLSPQLLPQLFLTNQYGMPFSSPYPTTNTPWSNVVPHSVELITPLD